MGTINIIVKVGNDVRENFLKDVLYVPELRGNLMSVNKTVGLGNQVTFHGNECLIKNGNGAMIAIAKRKRNLYELDAKQIPDQARIANHTQTINLWHRRLGHLSAEGICQLVGGLVEGLRIEKGQELNFCNTCVHGKQHRDAFPTDGGTCAVPVVRL